MSNQRQHDPDDDLWQMEIPSPSTITPLEELLKVENNAEIAKFVYLIMSHLKSHERYIYWEYHVEDRRYSEIAWDLGMTKKAVKTASCRAKKKLLEVMEKLGCSDSDVSYGR